jgi:catechol 2,3-dioxygenase-like lactoylglutathione lyase family enzyme
MKMKKMGLMLAATGLVASFLDVFPMAQAENPPPAAPPGYRFNFVRLFAHDIKKSVSFYEGVLGLHELRRLTPPTVPAQEVFLGSDDPRASLIDLEERTSASVLIGAEPNAGSAQFCFEVPDVAAALQKAKDAGAEVVMPGGHVVWSGMAFDWAVVDDPDGNHIEFIHNEPAPAASKKGN